MKYQKVTITKFLIYNRINDIQIEIKINIFNKIS